MTLAAAEAAPVTRRAAMASRLNDALLRTQDKVTSRTCFPDPVDEMGERRIILVSRRQFLQLRQRSRIAAVVKSPEVVQPLDLLRIHVRHRLPHLDRGCPAAEHDPAHRPEAVDMALLLRLAADQ